MIYIRNSWKFYEDFWSLRLLFFVFLGAIWMCIDGRRCRSTRKWLGGNAIVCSDFCLIAYYMTLMEGTCFRWKITFTAFRKVWRVLFQEVIKPFVVEWSFRSLPRELRRLFNPDPIYCEVFLELQIQLDSTLNDEKRCFYFFPVLASRSHKLNNRRDLARKSVTYKFNIQVPFKAFSSHTVYISIQYPRLELWMKTDPTNFDRRTFTKPSRRKTCDYETDVVCCSSLFESP